MNKSRIEEISISALQSELQFQKAEVLGGLPGAIVDPAGEDVVVGDVRPRHGLGSVIAGVQQLKAGRKLDADTHHAVRRVHGSWHTELRSAGQKRVSQHQNISDFEATSECSLVLFRILL